MEEARLHLGPVRIAPWLSLKDIAWIESGTGEEDSGGDLTATAGAGLKAYLRSGSVYWTAEALPEYVWWQDAEDRRSLNGRYGAAVYGFWNRLLLELSAGRDEQQQIVTSELLEPSNLRQDLYKGSVEAQWTGALSTLVSAQQSEQTSLAEDDTEDPLGILELLDRRERTARGVLRLRPRQQFMIGIGAEHYEAEFSPGARAQGLDRSNSGTSPLVEMRFERPGLYVQAEAMARSLEAEPGSQFVDYDRVAGNGAVALNAGGRVETWIYGGRNLAYSLFPQYAYLDDERLGAALRMKLGWRTVGRVFIEGGTNDYTVLVAGTPPRQDDYTSYGASLELELGRTGSIELQAVRMEFESSIPEFDRNYTSIGAAIVFAGQD